MKKRFKMNCTGRKINKERKEKINIILSRTMNILTMKPSLVNAEK